MRNRAFLRLSVPVGTRAAPNLYNINPRSQANASLATVELHLIAKEMLAFSNQNVSDLTIVIPTKGKQLLYKASFLQQDLMTAMITIISYYFHCMLDYRPLT